MDISNVAASADSSKTRRAGIQQEDFLKVLLAQMQFQDPLKPLENSEFIAQFAQLTSLEQTQQLNDKLDSLLTLQNGTQAINLIGRSVEAETNTGSIVGQVTSVAFQDGSPTVTLRTQLGEFITGITMGQVSIVR